MEEASSIAKAIEKGWARAGKPQEFTVKVFEEAQKNFIGMTTKPAKIGLFFEENSIASAKQGSRDRMPVRKTQPSHTQKQPQGQQSQPRHAQTQPQRQERPQPQQRKEAPTTSPWSNELIEAAREWVQDSLTMLGQKNATFSVDVDRYALKLQFNQLITKNGDREKMLFRAWAYLIMQALRQKFKRPLKGLKIILMSNNA